jgi:phosphatidylcholine synthase
VLRPEPWLAFAIVVAFAVLTFVPLRFLHPVRVVRHRVLNLMVLGLWSLLAIISVVSQLAPATWIKIGLLCAAAYFCGVGFLDRAQYGAPRLDRGP